MSTQRQAATNLREALSEVEQQEIAREMERNAGMIRRGQGEYATLAEAQATAGLNQLRDELHQVEQALTRGGQAAPGQNDKEIAQALDQVERLRHQMEQLQSQLAGRARQQSAQPGAQGQPSRQGQSGQPGGSPQSAPGSSGGGQLDNSGRYADGGGGLRDPNGPWRAGVETPLRPEDLARSYRGTVDSLGRLEQQLRDDPATARDIRSLLRDLRNLDPLFSSNDPLLSQRIEAALAGAEQVEMELRRKIDELSGGEGTVRSPSAEPVPQGYQDAVADYFRRLSKTK
jgi:ElaB/YqjD/DUF883 family membrane-anchored ribosome-binding protein